MRTPSEIQDLTLAELREMRTVMASTRWLLELEDEPPAVREQAARDKLRLHHAIVRLENAKLRDIRDKLLENEQALVDGQKRLEAARRDLEKIEDILAAVGSFLDVVGRVAKLIL